MFNNVCRRAVTEALRVRRYVSLTLFTQRPGVSCVPERSFADVKDGGEPPFDPSLLEVLVCPLSKKTLRYEPKTNELINEELGIAYPIIDGIPNMIPQDARLTRKDTDTSDPPAQ
ncbi:protein preY, mitochondrial [Pholidichthys leucotaenia]